MRIGGTGVVVLSVALLLVLACSAVWLGQPNRRRDISIESRFIHTAHSDQPQLISECDTDSIVPVPDWLINEAKTYVARWYGLSTDSISIDTGQYQCRNNFFIRNLNNPAGESVFLTPLNLKVASWYRNYYGELYSSRLATLHPNDFEVEPWIADTIITINNNIVHHSHGQYQSTSSATFTFHGYVFKSFGYEVELFGEARTVFSCDGATLIESTGHSWLTGASFYSLNGSRYAVFTFNSCDNNGHGCRILEYYVVKLDLARPVVFRHYFLAGMREPTLDISHGFNQRFQHSNPTPRFYWLSDYDGDHLPELYIANGPDINRNLGEDLALDSWVVIQLHPFKRDRLGQVLQTGINLEDTVMRFTPQALFHGYETYFTDSIVVTWVSPEMPPAMREAYGIR